MTRRGTILLALGALALVGVVLVKTFQPQLGTFVLRQIVAARVGRDVTVGMTDGLHVALCGTGSPLPDPYRAGPCTVVIAGSHVFVVDAGEGGGRNIALMGLPIGRVEAVFLTHLHSDHIDGLGPIMLLRWSGSSATAPLPVHGPEGVDRVVAGVDAEYAVDTGYRIAHHGPKILPPSGQGGVAMPFVLPAIGQGDSVLVYDRDGLRVTAFRVDHGPVKPAVGYRFDYKGRSVVLSGDTAATPLLVKAARGADLLVHEGLQPKLVRLMTAQLVAKGQPNVAQITRDIDSYHTTPEDAAHEAQAAGVKQLVFSHIIPQVPTSFAYPAWLGDAPSLFHGPITVGEDGMMFDLPVGSTAITMQRLM